MHWPDVLISGIYLIAWATYIFHLFYRKNSFATLLHLIVCCVLASNTMIIFYFLDCTLKNKNSALYWLSYLTDLIISVIVFSGKIAIYFFTSLGLGFCFLRERGYQEYSAIYVFAPGYLICALMEFFTIEGFFLCSAYYQALYVMLLKNIQSTVSYIERNPSEFRERQKKMIKTFKDLCFWYCQACSLKYAVVGIEYLAGEYYLGVWAGMAFLETFCVLLTVYFIRPRFEAGFCEELLFDVKEPGNYVKFFQADIVDKDKYDGDTEIVAVEYPDCLKTIASGKALK